MKNLFLMSDRAINQLRSEIHTQQQIGTPRQMMAASSYRRQENGLEILRIHGPVLSRPSWVSQLLGLRTTEEHLDNLSSMLSTGVDVLLDIDSVGGDANLAFEFADMIRSGGDRVRAYSGGYAASAGMLFLTAASKSYAHRSATLGSIGVVGFADFSDNPNMLYSDNATNKKPNIDAVRRDINSTESLFLEYVSTGTGLTREQVVTGGNSGDIFSGDAAVTNGFITGTTTLQNLIAGKPSRQEQVQHEQMFAFVQQQMKTNPKVTPEKILSNYLALHPTSGTQKPQQSKADDDWLEQLTFMGMRRGRSREEAEQRARQAIDREDRRERARIAQQQPQQRQADSKSDDWETRLQFMRNRARNRNRTANA